MASKQSPEPDPLSCTDPTEDLIRSVRSGDAGAWKSLDARYRMALYLFMRGRIPKQARGRFDTDDLLQSAFLSAFRELDSYQDRGQGSFLAWMTTILENRLRDKLRRVKTKSRDVERSEPYQTDVAIKVDKLFAPSPSEVFSKAEDSARLLEAIADLEPELGLIVRSHFFDKTPLAHIARDLGRDVKTVRGRLSTAITILLSKLR